MRAPRTTSPPALSLSGGKAVLVKTRTGRLFVALPEKPSRTVVSLMYHKSQDYLALIYDNNEAEEIARDIYPEFSLPLQTQRGITLLHTSDNNAKTKVPVVIRG